MLLSLLLSTLIVNADTATIRKIAVANGYMPTKRVMKAISSAAKAYNIPVQKMTAIAITETGIGKFTTKRLNKNGTYDSGLFQINTINKQYCLEYDLYTDEGSAMCAAKLLSKLRKKRPHDWYGAFHSKTPSFKSVYMDKINKVLKKNKTLGSLNGL